MLEVDYHLLSKKKSDRPLMRPKTMLAVAVASDGVKKIDDGFYYHD